MFSFSRTSEVSAFNNTDFHCAKELITGNGLFYVIFIYPPTILKNKLEGHFLHLSRPS
jgi:hypothetical protein